MKKETKLVRDFLRSLGYKVFVRSSNIMQCDMLSDTIFLDIEWFNYYNERIEQDKKTLENVYKTKGWKIDISQGTFAILHELGHILTSYDYKNLSLRFKNYQKKVEAITKENMTREQGLIAYRNLTLENDADKMAYEVYKQHKEKIDEFDKQLIQLLNETYATA